MKKKFLSKVLIGLLSAGIFSANISEVQFKFAEAATSQMQSYNLNFDSTIGVEKVLNFEGRAIKFVAYENIVYVKNPASAESQKLSIFIPTEYLTGGTVNGYTAKTAPIFMPNGVGGYMPGSIQAPSEKSFRSKTPNAALTALSRGLVVVSPAIRGRTTVENNIYVGKAPALIVDYKAAVRYLRANKNNLPAGDVEKIISNGTSAGGALSAALGSMGNAPEFEKYLQEIGAADERDDIFASSDYCPITNLENADKAYEWIFYGENKYFPAMWQLQDLEARGKRKPHGDRNFDKKDFDRKDLDKKFPHKKPPVKVDADAANNPTASTTAVDMTAEETKLSKLLRDAFPDYVNSLNLHDESGKVLTLDKNGEGTFKDYIKQKYIDSAQKALDEGKNISADWLTIQNGKVTGADLKKYPAAVTRMKAAPAFDKADLSSAENDEFGTSANQPKHFNALIQKNSGGEMADAEIIKLMNPLNFIGRNDVTVAKHFRIRHGSEDRDTALAIPAILALKLQNAGVDVDFFSPWGIGHAGDYDLQELFDWIDSICR